MSTFDFEAEVQRERASLINETERAAVRTRISRQRLPEAVAAAGWTFVQIGERANVDDGNALIIGVAAWNLAELAALSRLSTDQPKASVQIFDIDDFTTLEDLSSVVPGVKPPTQTPVVALYTKGTLVGSAEGADALGLLSSYSS